MSVSTYLEFALLLSGQADKETWMNEAIEGMGAAFAATYALSASTISAPGQSLTLTYDATNDLTDRSALRFILLNITGTPTDDFNVIHPAKHHLFIVKNNTAKAATVKTPAGTGILVPAGEQYALYCDGTNVIRITFAAGASTLIGLTDGPGSYGTAGQMVVINGTADGFEFVGAPIGPNIFSLMTCFMGLVPDDGFDLMRIVFDRAVDFVDDLPTSIFNAGVASTGTAVFTLKKNGSSFGTITFTTSATGVCATTAATSFAIGDILSVTPPSPQDATLTDVSFTFQGTKG